MALLSDLVRIVAAVEGLEEVSFGIFARHAREAGLISQGGRGRSAAKMSIKDAANLLIAVNGCHLAKDVSTRVNQIRQIHVDENKNTTTLGIGEAGGTFGFDLERLMECFLKVGGARQRADPPGETYIRFFRPNLMVEIEMNPSAAGGHRNERVTYGYLSSEHEDERPDRWDEAVISHRTLRAVAEAL